MHISIGPVLLAAIKCRIKWSTTYNEKSATSDWQTYDGQRDVGVDLLQLHEVDD